MKNLWTDRSPRERALLSVAFVFFLGSAAYFLVAAPLSAWRAAAVSKAVRAEAAYEFVAEAAAQGAAAPIAARRPASASSLRSELIATARAVDITLNFVNARPDGDVEASAEAAPSAALFDWLRRLENQHGIIIANADIAREPGGEGLVRAQLVFRAIDG